jgi:hypothetical protein
MGAGATRRKVSLIVLAATSASAFQAGAAITCGWFSPRWEVACGSRPSAKLRTRCGAPAFCALEQDGARSRDRGDLEEVPLALSRQAAQETKGSVNMIVKMRGDPEKIMQKLQQSGLMDTEVCETIILRSDKARLQQGTVTLDGRRRVKERSYFGTPLTQLILRRSSVLTVLMFMQSLSSLVLSQYEELIAQNVFLALFLTMLTGTGGNAGNQSSSMVIRGMSTGEINNSNMGKVICREILASSAIALILAAAAFGRVVMTPGADSTGATGLLFFSAFHWLSAAHSWGSPPAFTPHTNHLSAPPPLLSYACLSQCL